MARNKTAASGTDALKPQTLLSISPAEAEKTFNSLSLDERRALVLATAWEKRRDMIMLDEDARSLVRSLPPDELYWTVLRTGIEDSLQLITLTSHEQLQFFFDMDCWEKDLIRVPAVATWYKMLSKCNELKVIDWFMLADDDFLVGSLKKLMKISKIQQQTDISEEYEDMPSATLDGIYFFHFFENDTYGYLMPLLNTLYQHDRDRFFSLAEGMLWDSDAETEEAAYEVKSRRLAEYGFQNFEESLGIYQILSDKELEIVARAGHRSDDHRQASALMPRYGFTNRGMPRFYMAVLEAMDDAEKIEAFQKRTIAIANRIIIADSLEVQSPEDAARALQKAAGTIGIALESLGRSDPACAASIAASTEAVTLFRAGATLIAKVSRECSQAPWHIDERHLLESFLQTPRGETLHGLVQKRPVLYEGLLVPGQAGYRAFLELHELEAAAAAVAQARELDRFVFELLGIEPRQLYGPIFLDSTLEDRSQISVDAVILTAFCSGVLHKNTLVAPLTGQEALEMIRGFCPADSSGAPRLSQAMGRQFLDWAGSPYGGELPRPMELYCRSLLGSLEETFSPLAAQKSIEKHYIDKLLFKRPAASGHAGST